MSSTWRYVKATLIFLVVAWHLFFFAFRNPLDLWDEKIVAWLTARGWYDPDRRFPGNQYPLYRFLDELTYRFANTVGCEQRWVMFSPPMAQRAPFLGVRLEFDDGSTVLVPSANEPQPPARFFRLGGWQTRKLEDVLMDVPDNKGDANPEWPMWVQYVRHAVRRWEQGHPDDPRAVRRVVLVKRSITFPGPDDPLGDYRYEEKDLITFDAEGNLP